MSEVENQLAVGKYRQKTRQTKIGIQLMNSENLIIDSLKMPSLNINLVDKQRGSHHYHLSLHVKIHTEIK